MTIGRIDINEKDLPKICGAIIQLEERADSVSAAGSSGSGGGAGNSPGGRLTLQTLTPVMTTTQSAKTTIYYTPYNGSTAPIYDGTNFNGTAFSELSVATTDTTKNPAAIGASKVNDWFVWSDSGTLRLSHGPDWTSDTARSAGTALVMVNGILLNSLAITNGPAASRGTYVGTTRSNASSQLNWVLPGADTAGILGVWNAYNRVVSGGINYDSTSSWTYNSTTIRQKRASANNSISFVSGLQEDLANTTSVQFTTASTTSGFNLVIGIGIDSTAVLSGVAGTATSGAPPVALGSTPAALLSQSSFGYHAWNALEACNGAETVTAFGSLTGPPLRQGNGFAFQFPM